MNKVDDKELESLLNQYNGFIHMMTIKYHRFLRTYEFDDLLQEFRMKFIDAVNTHDYDKGKLTTFSGLLMKHHFVYLKRHEMAQKRPDLLFTLDLDIQEFEDGGSFLDIATTMYDIEPTPHEQFLRDKLEKEIKEELSKMHRGSITWDFFLNEMSTNDIAEKYNISIALVKYINKINIMKLKNKFKDYIVDDFDNEQFNLDDFNDIYDKEFFNGK